MAARAVPRAEHEQHEQHEDLGILVEELDLLALMIGFSVSIASNRYDQRKILRKPKTMRLGSYCVAIFYRLGKRKLSATCLAPALTSLFYTDQDDTRPAQIDRVTSQLKLILGRRSRTAAAQPTLPGARRRCMNEVTQFARLRPGGVLETASTRRVAGSRQSSQLCSNALFGWRLRNGPATGKLSLVLPFVVSIAFLLIADIDAPRTA